MQVPGHLQDPRAPAPASMRGQADIAHDMPGILLGPVPL